MPIALPLTESITQTMYSTIQFLHSYWAYLVVLMVFIASANALIGVIAKKEYQPKDFRISLFALIVTHIQLLIGLILFSYGCTVSAGVDGVCVAPPSSAGLPVEVFVADAAALPRRINEKQYAA